MLTDITGRGALFVLILLWLAPVTGFGQTDLSLRELVDQALETNYQIQVIRQAERIADNSNTRGNAGMLPEVNMTGELRTAINNSRQEFFTGDSQQANNARRNSASVGVEARWVVFDGLAMFARKDRLEQLVELSRADTRFFMEQTVADLATAYYQLQQEAELLDAFRESLEVSRARLDFAERARAIGTGTELDIQLARVDFNTDSSLVINQESRLLEFTLTINRLINRELTATVNPTDSIRLHTAFDLPALIASAKTNNTALSQQQLAELIALSESEMAEGALYPQVELYGRYDFSRQKNEIGFLQSSRSFGPEYGIRVRFNLFTGRQEQIARENAIIAATTEQLRSRDLDQEIETALHTAYLRWENRRRQAVLEEESMAAAAKALEIARGQYELGALTNIEFRVIQLNVVNAKTRFLQAQYQAKYREIELLRLSGQLLQEVW
ncbi:MAG: TolC family protein [Lewinella sp.]|nr:TolC family protein [Lewinella sp.]